MNWSNLFVMLITFVFINNVVLNQFLGKMQPKVVNE